MDRQLVDSAKVKFGRFKFKKRSYPAGFYQLVLNDTDRVDLILVPNEKEVKLEFNGLPLQQHILVLVSDENKRLWEYKQISRRSQERIAVLKGHRNSVDADDTAGNNALDSLEENIRSAQRIALDRLLEQDPASYFSHVVKSDRAVSAVLNMEPLALAHVIDWADDRILRSTVFPKALMAWIQHCSPELPDGYISAIDSVMTWTRPNPQAWSYARSYFIRLFEQYGPDPVAQYVVDKYAVGPDVLVPLDKELATLLTERAKVSIGAIAPNVVLPDPQTNDTIRSEAIITSNEFTCIFFYSSNCDHCHEQIPLLNQIRKTYEDKDFELIGIALDADLEEFQQTLIDLGIKWPSFSDLIGWGSPAAKAFQVKATPTFFLLDRKGAIIAKPYDSKELEVELKRRLP
jgi:thiol-disulfide isomerase/thioredoxin